MYYGESHTTLDEKGRLTVPVQFRPVMETFSHETWFFTRGFDGSIFLFPNDEWTRLLGRWQEFRQGETLNPRMLDFRRLFLGSVAKVKKDGQWRMLVPAPLREYAGISREAVLLGVEEHLEMWSKEGWRKFQEAQMDSYKAMGLELFSSGAGTLAATEGDVQGD
mgnify:FL=1